MHASNNITSGLSLLIFLFIGILFSSCEKEIITDPKPDPDPDDIPTIYAFERNGASTVDYSGQVVRQLLIQDMKIAIDKLSTPGAAPIAAEDLLKFFDKAYSDDATLNTTILTSVSGVPTETSYFQIHPDKDLKGKLAIGYDLETQIISWVNILVSNSNDPDKLGSKAVLIDEDTGLDLAQALQKTLLGAVAFSQAMDTYLFEIESRENNELMSDGNGGRLNYTEREHFFDEAFGYFGAARNFADFSDEELASANGRVPYKDNFVQDGEIDWSTEYNFAFSTNAGKRDRGSSTGINFSGDIFDVFLRARHAIATKNDINLIQAKEDIIRGWEQIIAATAIHYINKVQSDLLAFQADPSIEAFNYYKHWAEMYFFTQAFRYSSFTNFDHGSALPLLETAAGVAPKYLLDNPSEIDAYLNDILEVRTMLQGSFGFDFGDVEGW